MSAKKIFTATKISGPGAESAPSRTSPSAGPSPGASGGTSGGPSGGPTNDRRFPRVYLHSAGTALSKVLGARGGWSGSTELSVCDLSYTGVAFMRSTHAHGPLSFRERERMELVLHLAGERIPFKAQATLVRTTDQIVAFDFRPLSTETRQAIERFLQGKLIGLHLRPVAREHFRGGEVVTGMTHWFQGPANTNVLLWFEDLSLKKAIVEVGEDWLQWSAAAGGGQLQERTSASIRDLDPTKETLSNTFTLQGLSPFVSRVVDILAHVPDEEKVLMSLIRVLTNTPFGTP